MPSDINGDALVAGLYANKAKLEEKAKNAGHLGGINIGPFGIPNQFLGFDLRTSGQKSAQEEPGKYQTAMTEFLRKLDECLDKAIQPVRPQ